MKYIHFFNDNIPYKIKVGLITFLLTTLGMNMAQEMPQSKTETKSKFMPFSSVMGMKMLKSATTYDILQNKPTKLLNYSKVFKKDFETSDGFSNPDTVDSETKAVKPDVKIVLGKKCVEYRYADGSVEIREGGTLPWRNKNPGALRSGPSAIGKANRFAVYACEEDGIKDLKTLLRSDAYCNLTLRTAISKYAPSHENNTKKYQSDLRRLTGLSLQTKVRDLTDEELESVVKTITQLEGWIPGKLICIEATPLVDTLAMAAQRTR